MIEKQEKIKKVNNVEILIISSTIDFSTDLICAELSKNSYMYVRLNRDQFDKYKITFNLAEEKMSIQIENETYNVLNKFLKIVYFRAPVFLRTLNNDTYNLDEQLYRSQWSAFIRNLIIFDRAIWMNNPIDTYKAENKLLQLKVAKECDFNVPMTLLTNDNMINISSQSRYICKSLDTALFRNQNYEYFTYSNIFYGNEIKDYNLNMAPVFVQELIEPKIDLRITVVGRKIFAVKVIYDDKGLTGDWRKQKDNLEFIEIKLPSDIEIKIINLMDTLNLNFAGIDMALTGDTYYFIEINPTGEWGWLVFESDLKINEEIVQFFIDEIER